MSDEPVGDRPPFLNVNLGHVLTIISMLAVGASAFYGMRAEIQSVGYRVERIEVNITQLTALSVVTATQTQQIRDMDRRLDRLEQRAKQ